MFWDCTQADLLTCEAGIDEGFVSSVRRLLGGAKCPVVLVVNGA
jgi:hypothetical protein